MKEIPIDSFWRVVGGKCYTGRGETSCGSFLASDGAPNLLETDLNSEVSADTIVAKLASLSNAWALVYYRADLGLLFIGRDIFGRYSLVWTKNEADGLVISPTVQANVEGVWSDVAFGQITVISVETMTATMHSFLEEYPESADKLWRGVFGQFQLIVDPSKRDLVTISRESLPGGANSCDQLMERLVAVSGMSIPAHTAHVAVAFSGGVDSLLVAYTLLKAVSSETRLFLVNVAFGASESAYSEAPDRIRALEAWSFLKSADESGRLRLVLVNVNADKLEHSRKAFISKVAAPAVSVLDDSLACVLWFALNAEGIDYETGAPIRCPAQLFFVGSGADELFAGYARHRTRFEKEGRDAVVAECEMELRRLGNRNGGRDARVAKQLGRTLVAPFLVDNLAKWANALPMTEKCDLSLPRGEGEKKIIRECLKRLGAPYKAPKQAMQFGSRMAKMSNPSKQVKGSDISEHLRERS